MSCNCFIIPDDVLRRFAADPELSDEVRQSFHHAAQLSASLRKLRHAHDDFTRENLLTPIPKTHPPFPLPIPTPPTRPVVAPGLAYDAQHGTALPGKAVAHPGSSSDASVKRAYTEGEKVAQFYLDVYNRDSIDGHHQTLVSTVHYSSHFNNAFWNGSQMVYGDGDGQVFVDFTLGDDVIGHELTHGVTQHSLALVYSGESGGLNESISDVFGSLFRQWEKGQTAATADWLIGADILGPTAKAKGYTSLRNLANPQDTHALSQQPAKYYPGIGNLDPHLSSGVPNHAFYLAATAIGGNAWEKAGQVWYNALTAFGPSPNFTFSQFANRTRTVATTLFPSDASIHAKIDSAWTSVGL